MERERLGCDHAEVGAWLAQRWKLPGYLQRSIGHSAGTELAPDTFGKCVLLSGSVADIWLSADTAMPPAAWRWSARIANCSWTAVASTK